jgi:hypothetical protein
MAMQSPIKEHSDDPNEIAALFGSGANPRYILLFKIHASRSYLLIESLVSLFHSCVQAEALSPQTQRAKKAVSLKLLGPQQNLQTRLPSREISHAVANSHATNVVSLISDVSVRCTSRRIMTETSVIFSAETSLGRYFYREGCVFI